MKTLIHWRETAKELPALPIVLCLVRFKDTPLALTAVWMAEYQAFVGVSTTGGAQRYAPVLWAYDADERSDLEEVESVVIPPVVRPALQAPKRPPGMRVPCGSTTDHGDKCVRGSECAECTYIAKMEAALSARVVVEKVRDKTFMDMQYSKALGIINDQREEIEDLKKRLSTPN